MATKLHVPVPAEGVFARPELLAALSSTRPRKLTLVTAPAGAGKTTLLAKWRAAPAEHRTFAWLSLDTDDNDVVRFWSCVLAALDAVQRDIEERVGPALRAAGPTLTERALPLLINELARLAEPLVLVLDDYHLITNPEVHETVGFLLDHLPSTVELALATRAEPPLPLARLRARGEMVEVGSEDLRLTDEQATALLNGRLRLDLEPAEIASLRHRTEGWAAGLQLVGLSLQGRSDRRPYIESFAGDDRHIVDYVASEVLDGQPAEVRRFLMETSILDRLSEPLCDAVTGREGSGEALGVIERSNMFLVPLDSRREWYRYHHLFGELLRHELRLTDPELAPVLHRRAHQWYEQAGFVPDAIRHAVAAGDVEAASELIAGNWLVYVNKGELETVENWTHALPEGTVEADPRLCLARGWIYLVLGRLEDIESSLQAAERGTPPGPMRDGSSSVEASAAMLRTSSSLMLGDVSRASRAAARAAELESDPTAPWRAIVCNAVGMTAYWSGRMSEALEAFGETVPAAHAVGNHTACIYALGYLALIHAQRGELDQAERRVADAFELAGRQALAEHWVALMAYMAQAEIAIRRGELAAAAGPLEHALRLAKRGRIRLDTAYCLLALARLREGLGDPDGARALLEEARPLVAECADPGILRELLPRTERQLRMVPNWRSARAASTSGELTERELGVLRLLTSDLTLREIGAELYISLNTVKTHARNIYLNLGVGSREEAVARARELGLV